ALLLELGHPAELSVARDGREQPGGLGVRGHVALAERRRTVRIETGREQERREVERSAAEVLGVVVDGDRVQVDDAEEAVAALLRGGVLAEAADQVAEVLGARRLDAGKDPHGSILLDRGNDEGLCSRPGRTRRLWRRLSPRACSRLARGATAHPGRSGTRRTPFGPMIAAYRGCAARGR